MKASRAPGPVQSSYVQNHRQRVPKGQAEKKPKKSDNNSSPSNGGVVKRYVNLDEIPDFDNNDEDVWNSMSNQKQQTLHLSSMQNKINPSNTTPNLAPSYEVRSVSVRQDGKYRTDEDDEDEIDEEDYRNDDDEDDENEWNTPYNNKPTQAAPSSSAQKGYSNNSEYKHSSNGMNYQQQSPPKHVQFQSHKPSSSSGQRKAPPSYQEQHDSSDEENEIEEDIFNYEHQPNQYVGMSSPKKAIPNAAFARQAPKSTAGNKPTGTGAMPPPQLPCEIAAGEKPLTEDEKLFFSKKPRAVEYKPYTLDQYKLIKPKEYVEIGKIKPDLNTDELIAKRKNAERIKEFSKQLRDINKDTFIQQPKLPPSQEQSDIVISKHKMDSKRTRALEFAKNIPRPKVPLTQGGEDLYKRSQSAGESSGGLHFDDESIEAAKLEELLSKHNQGKAKMDAIKKSLLH